MSVGLSASSEFQEAGIFKRIENHDFGKVQRQTMSFQKNNSAWLEV